MPPPSHIQLIRTPAGLDRLIRRLQRARRVSLDLEADSLHHYFEKICLIQVYCDGAGALVDPLADLDVQPCLDTLAHRPLIMHGADYDLRMLGQNYNFRPRKTVFDTAVAAQLLGYTHLGLAALTKSLAGVEVSKKGQKSDWSRRPLKPALLHYALDDVRHLETIADRLAVELAAKGRTSWHHQGCERLVRVATTAPRRQTHQDSWRIKGLRGLSPEQLAFVRAIWHWRDHAAQQADRPPFHVMPNHVIIELAVWACEHPGQPLESGPALSRTCRGKRRALLIRALQQAEKLPPSRWPQPPPATGRPPEDPRFRRIVRTLAQSRDARAHQLGLAPSTIAPKAALIEIAKSQPQTVQHILCCTSLLRWQAELLQPIAKSLWARKDGTHPHT